MTESPSAPVEPWPEACQSMDDLSGWGEVNCAQRETFFRQYGDRLKPYSALTDPDGQYGTPVVYTEWGAKEGEKPWLRDYRWIDGPCRHYMPAANIAWPVQNGGSRCAEPPLPDKPDSAKAAPQSEDSQGDAHA